MNFAIIYEDMEIEHFTSTSMQSAEKYAESRYSEDVTVIDVNEGTEIDQ